MPNSFEDIEFKYKHILKTIDLLRSKGLKDNDPELVKARIALRDLLELKKKNSTAIQKVVPRLTGIKTISIATKQLGELSEIAKNKYAMLGIAVGVCALLYYFVNGFDKK